MRTQEPRLEHSSVWQNLSINKVVWAEFVYKQSIVGELRAILAQKLFWA